MRHPVAGALAAVAVALVLVLPAGAVPPPPTMPNPIKNQSFERDFDFWTVDTTTSGGTATILSGQVQHGGGFKFARLVAEDAGVPTTVEQTFNALAFTRILGYARFNDAEGGSCTFDDSAFVEIDGNPVFQASSCTTGSTGGVFWTYDVSPGIHTIVGGVMNAVDSDVDSSLDLDGPNVVNMP